MINIIEKAKSLNKHFDDLSTEEQFKFIIRHINKDVIMEELVWYYDSKFGSPYDSSTLINKIYANKFRLEEV